MANPANAGKVEEFTVRVPERKDNKNYHLMKFRNLLAGKDFCKPICFGYTLGLLALIWQDFFMIFYPIGNFFGNLLHTFELK